MGTRKEGCGGLHEQVPFQGLDSACKCRRDFVSFDRVLTLAQQSSPKSGSWRKNRRVSLIDRMGNL